MQKPYYKLIFSLKNSIILFIWKSQQKEKRWIKFSLVVLVPQTYVN